ncbi:MAG: efflux RND transporter periplasmic adaptor subunit [Planctomycetota bacterium]|jgi:Cu(I)/Ag(I) efflux system membrane fusion protein
MSQVATIFERVWRSTAAIVALVLILAAFVTGWLLRGGEPAAEAGPGTATASAEADVEYTCSMHPQVRLKDPNAKCPICFMDLIPATTGGDDDESDRRLVMTTSAMRLAEIRTTPVERRFPTREVRMFGRIDYDETRIANIAAYFPGRLERLYVDYTGVPVQKGEHLVLIYSPELIATHAELREALAAVEGSRSGSEMLHSITQEKLEATRGKLRLWGLTDEQILALETSDEPFEQMTIYSPISGVVIEKMAVEGMYIRTGDPIFKVADFSHLWVRLEAYESQLPWLRFGQEVEFGTDSMPGASFTGRISFIDPVVDRTTRTVRVRLNVDNEARRLKPGMFVRAVARARVAGPGLVMSDDLAGKWICPMHPEVIGDGAGECDLCGMPLAPIEELGYVAESAVTEPPLVIPASAPLITGRRAVVYVRVPDQERPTFEGREIALGARAGDVYIVESGLEEGEAVVVHGAFKIDSAMQIAAKPSMMNPDPAATQPADSPDQIADPQQLDAPIELLEQLRSVLDGYLDAQEALAGDDLDRFRAAAHRMHDSIAAVTVMDLPDDVIEAWMPLASKLRTDEEHIDHLADLDAARAVFETYSDAAIELAKRFGHTGDGTVYVTYCPMAFDFKGASWLAREREISNPYFGASMLRCGEVRAAIPPRAGSDGEEVRDDG